MSDEPINDPRLEAYERELASVLVDRKLLEEALEQIEATWVDWTTDRGPPGCCISCGNDARHSEPNGPPVIDHDDDCRYVRVRDALSKALAPPQPTPKP
jgi:hypothetical protein